MKFTYRLSAVQELAHPAFYEKPAPSSKAKRGPLDRREINKAVEQLRAGADIHVIANDDAPGVSLLVFELTFLATKVFTPTSHPPRTVPGHLFILFHGEPIQHKIW